VDGLSTDQRFKRQTANLRDYPAVVSMFFQRKFELFLEHVGVGILGADAWWGRYEWQVRAARATSTTLLVGR